MAGTADNAAWFLGMMADFVADPTGHRQRYTSNDEVYVNRVAAALEQLRSIQADHDRYRRACAMINDIVDLALEQSAQAGSLVEAN